MTTAKRVDAIVVLAAYEFEGTKFVTTKCSGYEVFSALPDVIELRGTLYGKTGWNSDVGQAYYKDDALIAALVTRTLKKEV